ncbi:MAG TPA: DUF418 domain-containing protein, partial [bacterium]|nr:DUF418 domain-containing protein [bacterium]
NMEVFGWPLFTGATQEWDRLPDRLIDWLIRFLAEGKFYPLFAFLFGFGMAVQMARTEARGARFLPLYMRRLVVLLLIGAGHALLLWAGDILVPYALLGFILILFRKRSGRTVMAFAVIGLVTAIAVNVVFITRGDGPANEGILRLLDARALRVYAQGTFAQIFSQRLLDLAILYMLAPLSFPHFFVMFLLGLYAGRRGFFRDPEAARTIARRALPWILGLGLLGNVIFVAAREQARRSESDLAAIAAVTSSLVAGPVLSAAYVAIVILLVHNEVWRGRLLPLAALGRMALTNYLLQSLICTTIFYSYGLGLFGTVGPVYGALLTVAIYAVQVPLSIWWLRRFRFGPVEWLWRSLTYWQLQPMRITVAG